MPALMGDSIYIITSSGMAVSLDVATGGERWRTSTHESASACTFSMAAGLGYVIAATAGGSGGLFEKRLVALDPDTGAIVWTFVFPSDGAPTCNLLVVLVDCPTHGKVAVFADSQGKVYKLELPTGKLVWSADGPQPPGFTTGGAILGPDGVIYVTTNTGNAPSQYNVHGLIAASPGKGVVSAHALSTGMLKWRIVLGLGNEANNAASIGPLGSDGSLAVVVGVGVNPELSTSIQPASGTKGRHEPAYTLALDALDGNLLWNYTMPLWHGPAAGDSIKRICLPDSSANIAVDGNGVVFVPHEDGVVYGIRDADGNGVIEEGEVRSYEVRPAEHLPGFAGDRTRDAGGGTLRRRRRMDSTP